ncbi:MAG TPA: aminopeptidase [bacterium]|nr:aminopeptidase [bacterium]
MTDPRIEKLTRVLVHYSLGLQRGQLVRIRGSALASAHILAAYREALRAGAHPTVRVAIDGLEETYYRTATDDQLRYVSELDRHEVETLDAELSFLGAYNTRALTRVDPGRMRMRREATRELSRRFMERAASGALRWCLTQAPTHADAQEAEMSLAEYEDFVYTAGHLDEADPVAAWERVAREQDAVCDRLGRTRTLRIVGPDTDLTVSVAGRRWISAAGTHNFPDGEVFTGPVEDATRGTVRFSFPAIYGGREVTDVRIVFEGGRVVSATAAKGEEFLKAMLDVDAGARVLGEFAFGLNYDIQQFTRNILFDEKIGGTLHMAFGAAYPETGGKNNSGLHWDMILDLRDTGAEVHADGEVVYRNGRFLT